MDSRKYSNLCDDSIDSFRNEIYGIRKIQENTYVMDSYQRLPLSDGNNVYSIPFSLNSALETDGSSIYASVEKYVLLDAINKSWMNSLWVSVFHFGKNELRLY